MSHRRHASMGARRRPSDQSPSAQGGQRFRRLLQRLSRVALLSLVVVTLGGGLGGGWSMAGAAEVPPPCLAYQTALRRCYGVSADHMRLPWQLASGREFPPHQLGQLCQAEAERLNGVCR
jgi:hypothetical protein